MNNGVGGYWFSHDAYSPCSLAENDNNLLQAANNGRMPTSRERGRCMRRFRNTVMRSGEGENYFFNIETNNNGVITSVTPAPARSPYDAASTSIYNDWNFGRRQSPTPPAPAALGSGVQWLGPGSGPEQTGSDLESSGGSLYDRRMPGTYSSYNSEQGAPEAFPTYPSAQSQEYQQWSAPGGSGYGGPLRRTSRGSREEPRSIPDLRKQMATPKPQILQKGRERP
jgi:hypothetical protein